jgi:hypothetical protein
MISLQEFAAIFENVEKYHVGSINPSATLCNQIPEVLGRICQRPGSRQVQQSECFGTFLAIPPDNF